MRRELDSANAKLSELKTASLIDNMETVGAYKLLTAKLDVRPDAARTLCDTVKAKYPNAVAVFATLSDGKLNFVACAGPEAVKAGAHAGNILKEISAICGGKGGGRPDSAMSGGKDIDKIDEALDAVKGLLG
jgi:alanyl-tRNA synthetase